MTIEDPQRFLDGVWDWAILKGCFGDTKIMPTDVDGLVERNGLFLVLETKQSGAEVPQGQLITFQQLAKTGKFTIFIIWGKKHWPERIQFITRQRTHAPIGCNGFELLAHVKRWFEWANNGHANGNGHSP